MGGERNIDRLVSIYKNTMNFQVPFQCYCLLKPV